MSGKKFCITFAGAPGSSKTPIAYYLSQKFNLPIFNNDSIRTEVIEDGGSLNDEEYLKRRDQRFLELVKTGDAFIFDASIDRKWKELVNTLKDNGYLWFIISMDLSKDLLSKLYQVKGYYDTAQQIDQFFEDHQTFLTEYGSEVNLHISDQEFPNRLELAATEVKKLYNSPQG